MTRQLISTNKQPLLRSLHAKRPPQSGFVQVGLWNVIGLWHSQLPGCSRIKGYPETELLPPCPPLYYLFRYQYLRSLASHFSRAA